MLGRLEDPLEDPLERRAARRARRGVGLYRLQGTHPLVAVVTTTYQTGVTLTNN